MSWKSVATVAEKQEDGRTWWSITVQLSGEERSAMGPERGNALLHCTVNLP